MRFSLKKVKQQSEGDYCCFTILSFNFQKKNQIKIFHSDVATECLSECFPAFVQFYPYFYQALCLWSIGLPVTIVNILKRFLIIFCSVSIPRYHDLLLLCRHYTKKIYLIVLRFCAKWIYTRTRNGSQNCCFSNSETSFIMQNSWDYGGCIIEWVY